MSVSKHHRTSSKTLQKSKTQEAPNYIYEHVRRIDGQQTIRKYLRCGLLGKGGFANCFISQNTQTHKKSATKIISKQLLSSQRTKLRLFNQIRLHKTLHHENVVQFYHFFQDRENVYIFLELCDNQSLNELIRIRGTFITPEIQSFMYGILNGVNYIHSKHIIHRDLKLGNIFVDDKLNIKIGDFGLATKLEFRKENKRTVCGTPNYIAPEILEGKGYHFEVDIWSIGVILYTLYFGCPPFETEQANTTYQRIRECNYVIPKLSTVPIEAIQLIQRILVRNPADRPTIQNILEGDFMRLGQGIFRQLPQVCIRKAPTKKDLSLNTTILHHKRKESKSTKKLISIQHEASTFQYVKYVNQVQENKFYFKMNNGFSAILDKGNEVVFKNQYGMFRRITFSQNIEERVVESPLKYLLLGLQKKFNNMDDVLICQRLLDQTLYPTSTPIYIKNLLVLNHVTIIMLSNNATQFHYQNVDYLITKKQEIIEIDLKRSKIRKVDLCFDLKNKKQKLLATKEQILEIKQFLAEMKVAIQKTLIQKTSDEEQLDQNSF